MSIGREPPNSSRVKMELASNYQKRELQISDSHWCIQDTFTAPHLVPVCAAFLPWLEAGCWCWQQQLSAEWEKHYVNLLLQRAQKYELTPPAGIQRGFLQLSVGRKGDVRYYEEEELKGLHSLVSSHMQPCSCLLKHNSGVHQPHRTLQMERLRPASSDFPTRVPIMSVTQGSHSMHILQQEGI